MPPSPINLFIFFFCLPFHYFFFFSFWNFSRLMKQFSNVNVLLCLPSVNSDINPQLYSWPRRAFQPLRYLAQGLHALYTGSFFSQSYFKHALVNLPALYSLWSSPISRDTQFVRPYFTSLQQSVSEMCTCALRTWIFPTFC